MANIRDLRRRIKSIGNIRQITKAMKAVSASKMRRAQDSVTYARPYAKRLSGVLGRLTQAVSGMRHPLLKAREPKRTVFLVITADRGQCGGFNSNIIRKAVAQMGSVPDAALICVGRKSRDFFRRRGYNIMKEYVGLGEAARNDQAVEIASYIIDEYSRENIDAVYMVYSEFVNVMVQRPVVGRLLPAETPKAKEGPRAAARADYIFEPSAEEVLADLLPKYVVNMVYQGLLETKAGEHSARMTAMDSATKNAEDMIASLTLTMNRARQAAITKEISEIVGGAAALE